MKTIYITGALICFITIIIVFFENASRGIQMMFLGSYKDFIGVYPTIIALGIGQGVFITLLIQKVINEVQDNIDNGGLDL